MTAQFDCRSYCRHSRCMQGSCVGLISPQWAHTRQGKPSEIFLHEEKPWWWKVKLLIHRRWSRCILTWSCLIDRCQLSNTSTTWLKLVLPCHPLATTPSSLTTRGTLCQISWPVDWWYLCRQMTHLCSILPRQVLALQHHIMWSYNFRIFWGENVFFKIQEKSYLKVNVGFNNGGLIIAVARWIVVQLI